MTNPMKKHATDKTRKIRGDRVIHMLTIHGRRWSGERLRAHNYQHQACENDRRGLDYMACVHESPRRLLTVELILKTKDVNQNTLTAIAEPVLTTFHENCIIVAVTPEKSAATVERF